MGIRKLKSYTPALVAFLLILPLVWSSCGGDSASQQGALLASIAEARSEKERVAAPAVPPEDIASLVRGDSELAFDLYRLLSEGDENLFFSPHSISIALAMAYAGARGDTEREMADALSFLLPQGRLHPAFNALDLALSDPGGVAPEETGRGVPAQHRELALGSGRLPVPGTLSGRASGALRCRHAPSGLPTRS